MQQGSSETDRDDIKQRQLQAASLFSIGDYLTCLEALHAAITSYPWHAPFHYNLGLTLEKIGRQEEAAAAYQAALALMPTHAGALRNLPALLLSLKRASEALPFIQSACANYPEDIVAWRNFGRINLSLGYFVQARNAYQRALDLDGGTSASSRIGLGYSLAAEGLLEQAAEVFTACERDLPEQTVALQNELSAESGEPIEFDAKEAWLSFCYERQRRCDWEMRERYMGQFEAMIDVVGASHFLMKPAFAFQALALGFSEARLQKLNQRVGKALQDGVKKSFISQGPNQRRERIRIAYLSHNFREHPTSHLTQQIYGLHDRKRFEVFCYALNPDDGGPMRRGIATAADAFVDCSGIQVSETADRIAADQIDILIGLGGYQEGKVVDVLLHRPAVLQVNYLSYLGTLGTDAVDYHITDKFCTPVANQVWWNERLVLLPSCQYPYNHQQKLGPTTARQAQGLPQQALILCAFNNSYKIEPRVFAVWCELLKALPQAVLWMYEAYPRQLEFLRRELRNRGLDESRIIFSKPLPIAEHLARLSLADIFLDTFTYNAHTTMLDALYAGVPAVTLAGDTTVARVGGSIMRAAGLEHCITSSIEAYQQRVLELASDAAERLRIQKQLLMRSELASPFNMCRTVGMLESAYEAMWQRHLAGQHPATLSGNEQGQFFAV